jgi:hypothetical protein
MVKGMHMFLSKIEAAVSVSHVEIGVKKLLDKFFHDYDLPMPRIKIVNQTGSSWLGRCSYKPSVDKANSTIEIQKRVLNDDKSLGRILAHELIHHFVFVTTYGHPEHGTKAWEEHMKLKRLGIKKQNGHGKEFQEWANKINSVMGKDYVTEKTDLSYVTEIEKEYYLIVAPSAHSGYYAYAWATKPSRDQQAAIQRHIIDRKGRLFMSKDERFTYGTKIGQGLGTPLDKDEQAELKRIYESGKAITPSWTKLINKLSDFHPDTIGA